MLGRPVIFGEVLFDSFPDGAAVLGGAPFNVAWHLQGFGLQPLLISRIGEDSSGRHVLERMSDWGMDTTGIQIDKQHPTGAVQVTLKDGQPDFTILPDQAYDFIEAPAASATIENIDISLLYHGTLAARSPSSHDSLKLLRLMTGLPAFVDINLRAPWWNQALVEESLRDASWVKLNDAELAELSGQDIIAGDDIDSISQSLREQYGIELLIVTLGKAGAMLFTEQNMLQGQPVPVTSLVDTVGAGDAFSSVILLGLIRQWPLPETLQYALEFASLVCSYQGATIPDKALYEALGNQWQASGGE